MARRLAKSSAPDKEPSTAVGKWLSAIEAAQKDFDTYDRRCDRILKRYLYERDHDRGPREFQMLWANQEIMRPAVYARKPNPNVQSRFKDGDPVARITAQLLERTIDVQFDLGDYNHSFELVRNDYLLFARGVPRIRYEPEIELAEDDSETSEDHTGSEDGAVASLGDGDEMGRDAGVSADDNGASPGPQEVLKCEWIKLDHITRRDFIHPRSRNWQEVPWVAYRAFLSRAELKKRWPKVGADIPLDAKSAEERERDGERAESVDDKATIFEIWDKIERKVRWVAKAWPDILEEDDPYLTLRDFFPSPRPAYGTLGDNLVPTPDYIFWQDQAGEINQLTARIGALTDSLKLVGFYEAGPEGEGSPEIEKAVRPGFENKLIAVKSWAAFSKGANGQAPIVWLPVDQIATIIKECVELRKQMIDDVYQITGVSDIMRGDTEAEETAAAQGIKSEWGAVRLKDKQNELGRIARDVTRMVAEVIASQFQIETMLECANMKLPTDADVQQAQIKFEQELAIWKQSQIQQQQRQSPAAPSPSSPPSAPMAPSGPSPAPAQGAPAPQASGSPPTSPASSPPQMPDLGPTQEQVMALLRNGVLRRYIIDIEVDSTIAIDQNAEQQRRVQFISEAGKFITSMVPLAQDAPGILPFVGQLFMFGIRAFPTARELEEEAQKMVDKLEEQAGLPPKPNPEQQKLQADVQRAQVEIEKAKIGFQTEQLRAKAETAKAQLDLQAAKADHGMKMAQMQMEGQRAQQDHQLAQAEHGMKLRTMGQEVQMLERKQAATQALDIFKDGMERNRMQREATTGAPAAPAPQAALPAPKKRKFAVVRNETGRISGLSEE